MGKIIYSFCKDGVRIDRPQDEIDKAMAKGEPIATDKPVISEGAIVTLNGHKGKVLSMLGGKAQVSWEDASISEVDAKDLGYDGRVEKGGPGSGRYSEEVKANNVKLHVARHLRRQGKLSRMKKGGPGSGRKPGDGKYNQEDTKSTYWRQQYKFKQEQKAKRLKEERKQMGQTIAGALFGGAVSSAARGIK